VFSRGGRGVREVRWSIDAADKHAVAQLRRAVIGEVRKLGSDADFEAFESVLGEFLAAETRRGHLALAAIVEPATAGPVVHLYVQGQAVAETAQEELRDAILRGMHVPVTIESTDQGTRVTLQVSVRPQAHGA
jgi:hypothetical protein